MEKEKLDNLKSLILTSPEYEQHPFAHDERSGGIYIVEVSKGNKSIFFFGCSHTNSPSDPLFDKIQKKIEEIKPDIAYLEGWEFINTHKDLMREEMSNISLEDARKKGEPTFTLKLAADANIDFESPEPDFSLEIKYLLDKNFSKKDILTFYMYRIIYQYQHQKSDKTLGGCKSYVQNFFVEFQEKSGWEIAELEVFMQEIISELDITSDKYKNSVDPIPWKERPWTVLNEISSASCNFRDWHIFERIAVGLEKYNKLFIVYGSTHAVKQEPALRKLLV